jgi:hypothetical protein
MKRFSDMLIFSMLMTLIITVNIYAVSCTKNEHDAITMATSSTLTSYSSTTQTVSSVIPNPILSEITTSTATTTTRTTTTSTSVSSPTSITSTTRSIPNISGRWVWNLTVTVATGECAGEEGAQSPRNIQITQNGKDITMSGFLLKSPSTSISGEITFDNSADKWIVKFSGSYAEDGGTTTTNYTLILNNTFDKLTGDENWDWNGSCSNSKSTVIAIKQY